MANPQTENGYTKIANELLEKIYALSISGGEFRLLLMVIRKTYGYGKKVDTISLSQFTKETGIDRSNVCKIIKSVVAKKLLHKAKSAYSINKNYEGWVVAKTPLVVARTPQGSGKLDNRVVAKTPHTKETITKETKYKEIDQEIGILRIPTPAVKKENPESAPKEYKKPYTPHQRVVLTYKMVSGYELEDRAWDRMNFPRCVKSAKALLDYFDNNSDRAIECIEALGKEFTEKGLTWTLETICKHASNYQLKRRNGNA